MKRLTFGMTILVLLPAMLAMSCGQPTAPSPAPTPTPTPRPTPAPSPTPSPTPTSAKMWELKGSAFSPSAIEVDEGDTVEIVNNDSYPHTFTAQNPETKQVVANVRLSGGQSTTFTFATKGVWKVWCTIHSDGTASKPATSGMKGKIGVGVSVKQEDKAEDSYQY